MTIVQLLTGGSTERPAPPPLRGDPGWQGKWFAIVPGNAVVDERLTDGAFRCLRERNGAACTVGQMGAGLQEKTGTHGNMATTLLSIGRSGGIYVNC